MMLSYFGWRWSHFETRRWMGWHSMSAGRPAVVGYLGLRIVLWQRDSKLAVVENVGLNVDLDLIWFHVNVALLYKLKV